MEKVLNSGLRKVGGRQKSPPTTALPGGGGYVSSHRPRKHNLPQRAAACFLALIVLYVLLHFSGSAINSSGTDLSQPPTPSLTQPLEMFTEVLERDVDDQQVQGTTTVTATAKPFLEGTKIVPTDTTVPNARLTDATPRQPASTEATTAGGALSPPAAGVTAGTNATAPVAAPPGSPPPSLQPAEPDAADENRNNDDEDHTTKRDGKTPRRTVMPNIYKHYPNPLAEIGEYQPEEPERLPGLTVTHRTYTPEELLLRYADVDYIYSFANGSESNHYYRKAVRSACLAQIMQLETSVYETPTTVEQLNGFATLQCMPQFLNGSYTALKSLGDLYASVTQRSSGGADNRDRETDELRHSIRSLEQHVQWHRGRVVIVSPGHHPTWVDGARNFLAGTCGGAAVQALRARGTHLRLTTVHQDAVMPYGLRFTADSHTIEQRMWRVKNATPVHVYMNDDYFVNRDVAITDLFNEYGGTIIRGGANVIRNGSYATKGASWRGGMLNTQQFNINELDVHHEDYLPENMLHMWKQLGRVRNASASAGSLAEMPTPSLRETVDVARLYPPEELPRDPLYPRRRRRMVAHAPFVYCTNMFRFLETRYEREFARNTLLHRGRKSRDLFMPFVYNAFVMARPWQASPQFLPYLLELNQQRQAQEQQRKLPEVTITLDNCDGCAPATLLGGRGASKCFFAKFMNEESFNNNTIVRILQSDALYFNINAGFNSAAAAERLRRFLHDRFPTPVFLEGSAEPATQDEEAAQGDEEVAEAVDTAAITATYNALMQLPVIGLVSYDEGVCPLVRSLSLAFANHHKGRVHVRVAPHLDAETAVSLREMRQSWGHRVVNAAPVPQCAYQSAMTVAAVAPVASVESFAATVLSEKGELDSGVELPSTCGAASGTAGLRVRGFVIDARTPNAPVASVVALREALAMPGQTLALEDFRAVHVGPGERDVVLVLARADADAKAVHWITGASENDLLLTYPVPVEAYEDMTAPLQWVRP